MKPVDFSEQGIVEIAWSSDSKELVYVKDTDKIFRSSVTGNSAPIGVATGNHPGFNADGNIIFEKDDQICLSKDGSIKVLIKRGEVVTGSANRKPSVSIDGKKIIYVLDNIFHKQSQDKNAYPYRSFLAMANATGSPKPVILSKQQWYGGNVTWMQNGGFLHYEYDSTSGARIHMVDEKGDDIAVVSGLYPSISPDLKRIACKPKGGQSVVIYLKKGDTWDDQNLNTTVIKLPAGGKLSGSSPLWIDNRFVLIDEAQKIFRVDINKQTAEEIKKIPVPVFRGSKTMSLSPNRELLAIEVETDNGFELQIIPLA